MSNGWTYMDPEDLRSEGYLAEANRLFFHPLGLALAVVEEDDGSLSLAVLDDRSDLEGWHFSGDSLPDVTAKAQKIREERNRRHPIRMTALGYWTQPVEMTTR